MLPSSTDQAKDSWEYVLTTKYLAVLGLLFLPLLFVSLIGYLSKTPPTNLNSTLPSPTTTPCRQHRHLHRR